MRCGLPGLLTWLIALSPALALHFPDTTEVKTEYRVGARAQNLPTDFFRSVSGDSESLHLEWDGGSTGSAANSSSAGTGTTMQNSVLQSHLLSARYEQGHEFDPDSFSVLVAAYGNGAAWHEWSGSAEAKKAYPGLEQQWLLKGYGGEKGWVGSGVLRGRYFVVFRESAPGEIPNVTGPLRLSRNLFVTLDTSSQWLHIPCPDAPGPDKEAAGGKPAQPSKAKSGQKKSPSKTSGLCFSSNEDTRLSIRIDRKKPLSIQAWLDEGESSSLTDIRKTLESVPDDDQSEYAKDLSQMLLGEAQMFLVKLAQRAPGLFNWPSWQLQDFKAGQIPAAGFLDVVRRNRNPGDSLPAFRYEDNGIKLTINLYYRGTFHLEAEER